MRPIVHGQCHSQPMIVRNNDLQVVISGNVRANSQINSRLRPAKSSSMAVLLLLELEYKTRLVRDLSPLVVVGHSHTSRTVQDNNNNIIILYAKTVQNIIYWRTSWYSPGCHGKISVPTESTSVARLLFLLMMSN